MTSSHLRGRPAPLRSTPPRARIHGLGELAAVVPYLLGFTPHESLTCLAVTGGRVGFVARLDLADVVHPDHGPDAVATLVTAVARTGAPCLMALVTSEHPVPDALVDDVRDCADATGLVLVDMGWQRGDRCRSLLCADDACCPPAGVPVDASCEAAATATFTGVLALPDRAAVAAEFDRPPGTEPAALTLVAQWESRAVGAITAGHGSAHALGEATAVLDLARAADVHAARGRTPERLDDDVVARAVVALSEITTRDLVWLAVDACEVHGQGLWLELARRAPSPYDASALFLLAWRSWRTGDGVRALLAAERADTSAGELGYSAARLLLDAVRAGIDPRSVPPLTEPVPGEPG